MIARRSRGAIRENTYRIQNGVVELDLRDRAGNIVAVAQFDEEDFDLVMSFDTWFLRRYTNSPLLYAVGSHTKVRMHALIMGTQGSGRVPDHINGDGLNNRRQNLRLATHAVNMQNRPRGARRDSGSGVRNVQWDPSIERWRVRIAVNGKSYRFGSYATLEEAAAVAEQKRIELHGGTFKDGAWYTTSDFPGGPGGQPDGRRDSGSE